MIKQRTACLTGRADAVNSAVRLRFSCRLIQRMSLVLPKIFTPSADSVSSIRSSTDVTSSSSSAIRSAAVFFSVSVPTAERYVSAACFASAQTDGASASFFTSSIASYLVILSPFIAAAIRSQRSHCLCFRGPDGERTGSDSIRGYFHIRYRPASAYRPV